MKGNVRFSALIGLVALVAIAVGVLVWPAPKEARAVVNYQFFAYWQNGLIQEPIDDVEMEARFETEIDVWTDWLEPDDIANGVYTFVQLDWVRDIEVRYWNDEWVAVDPAAIPGQAVQFAATYEWHEWEFEPAI